MPKNQYCRDYLMHKSGKGLFSSLYDFGVGLADKSAEKKQKQQEWEAQRVKDYAYDNVKSAAAAQQEAAARSTRDATNNTIKAMRDATQHATEAARTAQQEAAARSTRDAKNNSIRNRSAMANDPRYTRQVAGSGELDFDKQEYNRNYYQQHKQEWQKGGKYYKLRGAVKNAISGLKNIASQANRTLQRAGETVYDKTHASQLRSLRDANGVNFGPTSTGRQRDATGRAWLAARQCGGRRY